MNDISGRKQKFRQTYLRVYGSSAPRTPIACSTLRFISIPIFSPTKNLRKTRNSSGYWMSASITLPVRAQTWLSGRSVACFFFLAACRSCRALMNSGRMSPTKRTRSSPATLPSSPVRRSREVRQQAHADDARDRMSGEVERLEDVEREDEGRGVCRGRRRLLGDWESMCE
jgi:hypothetical protein